ncbi:hypothetical protein TBLA_0F02320 [Henningerozyma blattae CBS 6284]|uniref:Uncharacterized protein n=1 Tax=Henningerozyma blattae (strain ATCC 34711 / CBS 6284 / DSM 70876 / NBRC 10599 / NRRL Y-10934 / UCD 77-7) TaxID=1071380 RepID=I2H5X1_HENB6|nr:hypothetical protein TBLA_0F02320 [Tetrapisispora blattae CBS 6284]CCH61773.1 hypothetical protein TBLA_0F02320 [Tetrapisispora blattae CBS 6284]
MQQQLQGHHRHRVALSDVTSQINNNSHNSLSNGNYTSNGHNPNLQLKQTLSHPVVNLNKINSNSSNTNLIINKSSNSQQQRKEEYYVKELDDESLLDNDIEIENRILLNTTTSNSDSNLTHNAEEEEEEDADVDDDEEDVEEEEEFLDEEDEEVEQQENAIADEENGAEEEDEEDEFLGPLLPEYSEKSKLLFQEAYHLYHRDTPDPMDDDTYDVVMVSELANDIFKYLNEIEIKYSPNPNYMKDQPELKWSFRSTLIDWIVQVHARFNLLPETLYLTVNIIDRFLSLSIVTLNKFQLVGAAALFIASKFEEINCPALKDIVYMLANAYSRDDVIKAERFMIDTLNFEIGWPGPMSFLRRISKADDYEYDIRTLAKYLLETTIMDSRLISAPPSWLAAGAYFLSRVILQQKEWTAKHVYYSGYTQDQIFPLATLILENCRYAQTKHEAIWKKYSERRQHHSAQIVSKWIDRAERKMDSNH